VANKNVTIGRIVRYVPDSRVDKGGEWPAIVTVVHSETTVSLQVFRQSDVIPATSVSYLGPETASIGGEGRGHTWHWPERG